MSNGGQRENKVLLKLGSEQLRLLYKSIHAGQSHASVVRIFSQVLYGFGLHYAEPPRVYYNWCKYRLAMSWKSWQAKEVNARDHRFTDPPLCHSPIWEIIIEMSTRTFPDAPRAAYPVREESQLVSVLLQSNTVLQYHVIKQVLKFTRGSQY